MLSLIEQFLTFKPNSTDHGALNHFEHTRVRFGAEFGMELDAAWFSRPSPCAVLFLHGNRHNITRFYDHYLLFAQLGIPCFTFDYPGYGASKGTPSEAALYASARAAYHYLVNILGFSGKRLAVYGCSLGGAVAIELVRTVEVGCLITESTFTNSHAIGSFLYPYLPISGLLTRRFSNDTHIQEIRIPKLILHGSEDSRVPVNMAHDLFQLAPEPKDIRIIPNADHVTCIMHGGERLRSHIGNFIRTECLRNYNEE